jgi:hypothetical protein
MLRQITLEQIIGTWIDTAKAAMYFRWPASVVAYHSATMTVDAQIMTNDPRNNLETDGVAPEPWPIILGVPVAWPRFGKVAFVGALNVGDPVVLEAFDVDPTSAFVQGAARSTQAVDPHDVRRHGGGYWQCLPANLTGPIVDVAELASVLALLGIDGDTAQILFAAGALTVGKAGSTVHLAGGTNFLVTGPWASGLATALGALASALTSAAAFPAVQAAGTALTTALAGLPTPATTATKAT